MDNWSVQPLEEPEAWVGPYRLLAELGAGGMGRVYLASGPDGALVAVKRIDPRYADDQGFRVRFGREVEACRRVSGAYTASVITADSDAPHPWLASVYVQGPSLAQVLESVGVLPAESAVQLTARLASALVDIHRSGLVHRDLKPSNVLLVEDGLRVIDFGIVRAIDSQAGDTTLTTVPVGSPAYMSPEQAKAQPVTAASDMFSLGVLLTVACTGRNPFHVTGDLVATLRNIVEAQPDLSTVPLRLRAIVERCLAKNPAHRPTPAQVLAMVGPIPPTSRPWPNAVYDQIARQRAELDRLLDGAPEATHVMQHQSRPPIPAAAHNGPGPSFEPVTSPDGPPGRDAPEAVPTRRSRRGLVAWLGAAGAVLAAFVLVIGLNWDRLTDALTDPARELSARDQQTNPPTEPADSTTPESSPTTAAPAGVCSINRGGNTGYWTCGSGYAITDIVYQGRCHTYVVGADSAVWSAWETTTSSNAPCDSSADQSGTWSTWHSLGGQGRSVVGASTRGSTLTIGVIGTDGNGWCNAHDPSTGWSDWYRC